MKQSIIAFLATIFLFVACENDNDNGNPASFTSQTVSMGANSAKDVYYSLANGEVSSLNRADWDIAFSVPLQTATILINEGGNVELYNVGDTSAWDAVTENSYAGKTKRFNNKSDWSVGAFNMFATGFPNYGWGTYHAGGDHNVGGDSLYVIKLTDGSYKKFMVRVKLGATSANVFRWADLNGENEVLTSLNTSPYHDKKHFIHFSLVNNEIVEAEPDMSAWDLLFTRYVVKVPAGPTTFMDYPVMGVLTNPDIKVAKVTGTDPEKLDLSSISPEYSTSADIIGYDWKVSDPVTHEISIADSTSYLIQSVDGNTWQLYFTGYGGNTAGTVDFKIRKIE
jgi:hypothetical protein